jgi:hypothetical protein
MKELIVGVMSCCSKPKYQDQIDGCKKTWVKECEKNNIPVYFFSGEEECKCVDKSMIVHLKGVKNDFKSSTYKQWYGLKHMYQLHPNAKFFFLIGTDTYINVQNLLNMLKTYNPLEKIYLGGHGDTRIIIENRKLTQIYFHSGGAGFILSNSTMKMVYPIIDVWIDYWKLLTSVVNKNLNVACDVSIAYLLKKYNMAKVHINNNFFGCNWKGMISSIVCCRDNPKLKPKLIVSCHYMNPSDMNDILNYTTF